MFSREEIKRNLLGCLEIALFMPAGGKRFGNNYEEALRSFLIPAFLFPVSILAISLAPVPEIATISSNALVLLYTLRIVFSWVLFFSLIAWILGKVDHTEHFYRFVTATNWLSLPATIVFIPVLWLVMTGAYTPDEIRFFATFLMLYTYAFTAYMAVYALVIPWELAMFITMVAVAINDNTLDLVHWIGRLFGT